MAGPLQTTKILILTLAIAIGFFAHNSPSNAAPLQTAVVAGGCFWCVQSDFERVKGVKSAVSGFTGGTLANPTYKQVSHGGTGHFESVKITFDPDQISYDQLLNLFFRSIDPTDPGGQFCDRGDTYRTAIFVKNDAQRAAAEKAKADAHAALGRKIVTQILPAGPFYKASKYHQDYYKQTVRVLTRYGPITKAAAYEKYRVACGRDQRVKQLWGKTAPFVTH